MNEQTKNYKIIHLQKTQWQNQIIPIGYTTEEYYDVKVERESTGFRISMNRKSFGSPVTHCPKEQDHSERLYEKWWPQACAWGVLEDGRLVAAIETCPEDWSKRLRVTELWVDIKYRKQGLGHALLAVAKEQARLERRRAVILETQSCNVNAIDFYLHEGFMLIGTDTCCYSNRDMEKKEVRLEFGCLLERNKRLTREEIEIRPEHPEEWMQVEKMVRQAFWNKYKMGCDEHYLVHKLRSSGAYLPEISRIAIKDGEIIGAVFYVRGFVQSKDKRHEVLEFGPLAVSPKWQGCGVGEMLLQETIKLSSQAGYAGIIIFGEPDYYPRMGFRTCDNFKITTEDGKNFDAFMGFELRPDSLKGIQGKYIVPPVFRNVSAEEAEAYDQNFPQMEKQYFPGQWD